MSEKLENKNKRGRLTWASSLCSPAAAGRPSQQAAQPASSSVVFVLDRGRGACPARARATAPRHQPPCLPGALLVALERPDVTTPPPPYPLTLPPILPLLSLALSLSCPNAPVAAVRHSRSHSLPLASPTRAEAPPRLPRLLRQATRRRTPWNVAVAFITSGRRRSPSPSIRRTQDVPEHTGLLCESAVSPSSFPLTSLSRACPVAAAPRAPEAAVRHGRRAPCPRAPPPRVVAPTCSCCLVATACALRSLERELQPHARAIPNSGRRRSRRCARLRPRLTLPLPPLDAHEPQLLVDGLGHRFDRRSRRSDQRRRVCVLAGVELRWDDVAAISS